MRVRRGKVVQRKLQESIVTVKQHNKRGRVPAEKRKKKGCAQLPIGQVGTGAE